MVRWSGEYEILPKSKKIKIKLSRVISAIFFCLNKSGFDKNIHEVQALVRFKPRLVPYTVHAGRS